LQAAKEFNIDLSQSYMIGDSDSDIEAGRNAGVQKSLKIGTSEGKTFLNLVNLVLSY
ncbi:HAD hydrolase-like protein, partial [Bacteroides ovatus]